MKRIIAMALLSGLGSLGLSAQPTYGLPQILDSARHNNIALRSARRNIASAHEQRREALTKYFPTISGSGTWFDASKSLISTSVSLPGLGSLPLNYVKDGVMAGVTAVQPIFAGGKIVNSNRLARVGQETNELQQRLTTNDVDRTAEQYFWQMVTVQEKLRTVAATERMLADLHKDVDVSVRAGVALRNDLLQVQLRQNEVESQKLKLNNSLALVRMLLAQYCGLNDTAFALSYDREAQAPAGLKRDHREALHGTAEYQLLGKQVEAARLERKLAVGQYMPSVGVGAGYSYSNLMGTGKNNATVFATISVPMSDWWGGTHAVRRKKIAQRQAEDEQQDRAELLVIKMQNAWNNVEQAYKQLGIAERSIAQSEENLRLHRDYYRAGTATMSDLLEAQMLYQQSQDSRADAFADYQNSILAYRQAVGQ